MLSSNHHVSANFKFDNFVQITAQSDEEISWRQCYRKDRKIVNPFLGFIAMLWHIHKTVKGPLFTKIRNFLRTFILFSVKSYFFLRKIIFYFTILIPSFLFHKNSEKNYVKQLYNIDAWDLDHIHKRKNDDYCWAHKMENKANFYFSLI